MFEVIHLTSVEEFEDKYLYKLKPVVIKNMFSGDRIRNYLTKERFLEDFGHIEIGVQPEYGESYSANNGKSEPGTKGGNIRMSVKGYFDFVEENPSTRLMAIEFPCTDEFKRLYRVPEVCNPKSNESQVFVNQCFVGNKGNFAHIHFDKAGTNGFLYQVFGRKKFIIFPKEAINKLAPFSQISAWNLESFSAKDHFDFLKFTGGQEVVLEAGDCIYVPAMCWHYADYTEDSMSISLRFRRPSYLTDLVNQLYPDGNLAFIAQAIQNEENAQGKYSTILAEIKNVWSQPYKDGVDKVKVMRSLASRIVNDLNDNRSPRGGSYILDMEKYFPPLLPEYLDADHPGRKRHI